ncbi:hypothetical protein [Weissella paramesenteroides]|nr:hypothetical protein [Weissella paramesenteroides]
MENPEQYQRVEKPEYRNTPTKAPGRQPTKSAPFPGTIPKTKK